MMRADVKSVVQRLVSRDSIVIMDAQNYIKGYRYEIWCITKAAKTTQCTVWCNTPISTAREWNKSRASQQQYSDGIIDFLVMRFEPPDSQNRWEKPLFTILPEDPLPASDILAGLLGRAPPPNQSTQSQPLAGVNYLNELDKLTQDIIAHIVAARQRGEENIIIPGTTERLLMTISVSPAELRRLRLQFISFSKTRPIDDLERIPTAFVNYLKSSLKID